MTIIAPPPTSASSDSRTKTVFRFAAALLFVVAGANHFLNPDVYRRIVPPMFPAPAALVFISGVGEILGGIGLLIPRLRRAAALGLIALLVAVFPANVYMAVAPDAAPAFGVPAWLLWLRLPLQFVLIAWMWKIK
jgi:uncharacterized membrane protein